MHGTRKHVTGIALNTIAFTAPRSGRMSSLSALANRSLCVIVAGLLNVMPAKADYLNILDVNGMAPGSSFVWGAGALVYPANPHITDDGFCGGPDGHALLAESLQLIPFSESGSGLPEAIVFPGIGDNGKGKYYEGTFTSRIGIQQGNGVPSNIADGWLFAITISNPVPFSPSANGSVSATLLAKGTDLIPGVKYELADVHVLHNISREGTEQRTCVRPMVTPYMLVEQAPQPSVVVTKFQGKVSSAGEVADGVPLGDLSAHLPNGHYVTSSISVRWAPDSWVDTGGGDAVTRLKSNEGGAFDVSLDCPGTSVSTDPLPGGQPPHYLDGSDREISCTIVKRGASTVPAGVYPMSIQAAVRNP